MLKSKTVAEKTAKKL